MRDSLESSPYGKFPSTYSSSQLADLCVEKTGIQTGPFGSQLHNKDYVSQGTPIITVEHINDNRISSLGAPQVSDDDKRRLARFILRPGDIVVSRVGSVDRQALVREENEGWLFSGRCLRLRPNPKLIDSTYLSYFMCLQSFKKYLRQIAFGATMPSLNTKIMGEVPIYYPSFREQRAIVRIIEPLDDKIELNHQMNSTLEKTSQALFKHWFIDFEFPNEEGEPYKSSGGDMVDSEFGEIPRDWKVATIGEEIRIVGGTTPSTKNRAFWEEGALHFATPKDLASLTSPVLLDTQRCITERGLGEISSGLLPTGVLLLSSRAPIGYLAISEIPVAINQGFIGMICDGELNNLFMLHWLQRNMDVVINNANGTTFLEINKRDFRRIRLVVPPTHALRRFTTSVAPLYSMIVNNMRESRHLMSIRDALLPRLISRKIKIEHRPDSKKIQSVRGAKESNTPNQKTLAEWPY
jgi:type I restriction enzyme S subunit